jgi:hypothetical protein
LVGMDLMCRGGEKRQKRGGENCLNL